MAMRHGITRRALGRIMPARNDYTDLRPAFLDGVVHVFVVAGKNVQRAWFVHACWDIDLCRLPTAGNRK